MKYIFLGIISSLILALIVFFVFIKTNSDISKNTATLNIKFSITIPEQLKKKNIDQYKNLQLLSHIHTTSIDYTKHTYTPILSENSHLSSENIISTQVNAAELVKLLKSQDNLNSNLMFRVTLADSDVFNENTYPIAVARTNIKVDSAFLNSINESNPIINLGNIPVAILYENTGDFSSCPKSTELNGEIQYLGSSNQDLQKMDYYFAIISKNQIVDMGNKDGLVEIDAKKLSYSKLTFKNQNANYRYTFIPILNRNKNLPVENVPVIFTCHKNSNVEQCLLELQDKNSQLNAWPIFSEDLTGLTCFDKIKNFQFIDSRIMDLSVDSVPDKLKYLRP